MVGGFAHDHRGAQQRRDRDRPNDLAAQFFDQGFCDPRDPRLVVEAAAQRPHHDGQSVAIVAGVAKDERGQYAWANTSADSKVTFRETKKKQPEYDGHHIQITLADFSGPHKKLVERGLISEESDQHQYRFLDIVDVDSNKPLFRIEHETRSMRHPMFNRVFVNRNPEMNNRNFVPGYEVGVWALA